MYGGISAKQGDYSGVVYPGNEKRSSGYVNRCDNTKTSPKQLDFNKN